LGRSTDFGDLSDPERVIRRWDFAYRRRSESWGDFLVCERKRVAVWNPPVLTASGAVAVFGGKMPGTQNPPKISADAFAQLEAMARNDPPTALGGQSRSA
jgi:hypothetical protein